MAMSDMKLIVTPRCYLIVMREVLIAQDLAQTIADYDAGATVLTATSLAQAEAMLSGLPALEVAFLAADPSRFSESGAARAIAELGARTVLLGVAAEMQGVTAEWSVLAQPFTTQAVLEVLNSHPVARHNWGAAAESRCA